MRGNGLSADAYVAVADLDPGTADARTTSAGGIDPANFGNGKSFAVAFSAANPNSGGTPSLIAGIPLDKSNLGTGIDGFTISQFKNVNGGLNSKFGASYGDSAGALAYNPSAAHPQALISTTPQSVQAHTAGPDADFGPGQCEPCVAGSP